jgi:hypothetical protein
VFLFNAGSIRENRFLGEFMISLRALVGIVVALVGLIGTYNLYVGSDSPVRGGLFGSHAVVLGGPVILIVGLVILAFSNRGLASTSRFAKGKALTLIGASLTLLALIAILLAVLIGKDQLSGIIAATALLLVGLPGIILLVIGLVMSGASRAQPGA